MRVNTLALRTPDLMLGAIGLTLMFLARLFEPAVDLQRELDEIF